MKETVCGNCGKSARNVRGDYQFKESGLRNLVLRNIEMVRCGHCGNVDTVLHRADHIMRAIAQAVLWKPYRLNGDEIRFLRKHVGLTEDELAEYISVDKTTLSKWENNEDPIGLQSDLFLRAVVMSLDEQLREGVPKLIQYFREAVNKQERVRVEVDAKTLEFEYA